MKLAFWSRNRISRCYRCSVFFSLEVLRMLDCWSGNDRWLDVRKTKIWEECFATFLLKAYIEDLHAFYRNNFWTDLRCIRTRTRLQPCFDITEKLFTRRPSIFKHLQITLAENCLCIYTFSLALIVAPFTLIAIMLLIRSFENVYCCLCQRNALWSPRKAQALSNLSKSIKLQRYSSFFSGKQLLWRFAFGRLMHI